MNFILIGSHTTENQTWGFYFLRFELLVKTWSLGSTSSSVVTTATIHLQIQIWLFLFIPQRNLPPHKNWNGSKIFISNFASLSWRIALKRNFSTNHNYPNSFTKLVAGTATNFTFGKWSKDFTTRKWNFPRPFQNLITLLQLLITLKQLVTTSHGTILTF